MKQFVSVQFDNGTTYYTYTAPARYKISDKDNVVVNVRGKLKLVRVVKTERVYSGSFPESQLKSIHGVVNEV